MLNTFKFQYDNTLSVFEKICIFLSNIFKFQYDNTLSVKRIN